MKKTKREQYLETKKAWELELLKLKDHIQWLKLNEARLRNKLVIR